ncbi:hypothetical protein SNOG_01317 [Parastagonospora nodorum SN15]|uniref:Uncharacterized protein n=1 Tax=Phaeosphaeria nodorum (strain SN15 / ATCC MYA-4574 / FGSC 10173) TaxID=321614 RepID=Q0V3U7_PHANO|nr:hypothetical protein SNOG_01317 [Parastagonospora nodorum SN15]EAT90966.1 hypothetical protein SNOG_01317 [Parastagonospora nodorum SN15]
MARNRWKPGTMDERPFVHEMKTTANAKELVSAVGWPPRTMGPNFAYA